MPNDNARSRSDWRNWNAGCADLVRQGLAHAQQQSTRYWDGMAERLWDPHARGLASRPCGN
ncbi:MAG: hypothetical protein R3F44_01485 [Candidatus Competibacteraceae bacterium]